MNDDDNRRSGPGPFGIGWLGSLIIIILATAIFAATRRDWTSMLIGALVLPVVMIASIHVLSRAWRGGTGVRDRGRGPRDGVDLLTFIARTNPVMFLFFGALTRGADDDRYQELVRSGPFGMGQYGYLIGLIIILMPLVLALTISVVTGQLPTDNVPH